MPDNVEIQHSAFGESSRSPIFFAPNSTPNDANDAKVPKVQIPQKWQNCKKCRNSRYTKIWHFLQFHQLCGICTFGTEKKSIKYIFSYISLLKQQNAHILKAILREKIKRNFAGNRVLTITKTN